MSGLPFPGKPQQKQDKKKVKDEVKEPLVEGFEIPGKRLGSSQDILQSLSQVSYIQTIVDKEDYVILNVESRDLTNKPYLFSIIHLKPDTIQVLYTVTPGMSPRKRRVDILRYFFTVLSMVSEYYEIRMAVVYQLFEDSIDKISEYVTLDYEEMYARYDSIKSENERLKSDIAKISETSREISKENYDLKTKIDDLKIKLDRLSKHSDDSLKVRLMEWINEHQGEINVPEVARMYSVPDAKIEELLNELMREGYLKSIS
ncbi:hypothetical protein KO465_01750 [Candidatus Micrarchaeota archaeon]|nr:hypothetical protein [Candidatus Micrarchaeota archaeon]